MQRNLIVRPGGPRILPPFPPPATAFPLPVGMWNHGDPVEEIGHGVQNLTTPPIFKAWGPLNIGTDAKITAAVNAAMAIAGGILILNVADSRGFWSATPTGPGYVFSRTLYEQRVRRFDANAALAAAIPGGRIYFLLVDEPNHTDYDQTLSPEDVNWMGQLHKLIWPGCHTAVRAGARLMTSLPSSNWPNKAGVSSPPPGGWTKVDWGWSQFESHHPPSTGETFRQFFDREKTQLASVNLGMIPGLNWWSGGNWFSHDGVDECWQTDPPDAFSGLIKGTFSGSVAPGTRIACGHSSVGTTETRFMASPLYTRKWFDSVCNDPDAPFVSLWTFPYDVNWSQYNWVNPLYMRSDVAAELVGGIHKCNARPAKNTPRQPKP